MSNSCLNEKNYKRQCPGPVDCFGDNEVFFRKVLIPTTMGDEKKYPPQNGAYRNALVYYEADGAMYIYSSDGLYTRLDVPSGVTSVNGMTGDVVLDIPEKLSQLQNDTGFITKDVNNLTNYSKTSEFSRVAFTGSYLNLSDRPAINDGTLMINRNGSTVGTFKANQSESTTVNIKVPVYTNELINNSQFVVDGHYVHTDNNFNDEFKNKLAHLVNITEIGDNLTLTNGRLDATGGGGGGETVRQVYRGDNMPTDRNILIWIDTKSEPIVRNAMITADDDYFITSDELDFVVRESPTGDIQLMTADDKEFIDANNELFITKGEI